MSSPRPNSRARVLDAAVRLHDEFGAAFTMEQLETAAGVSRASIYRSIGGKEDILRLLADERGIAVAPRGDTRRAILEAARREFSVRGPYAATIEDVAATAGVGVATVYRHFGDKEHLVRAFLDEMTPRSLIRAAALQPTGDVAADLTRIVRMMVAALVEHRDVIRLTFLAGDDDRAYLDKVREPADSTLARMAEFFQAHLDAGRLDTVAHADELALALMGMVLFTTVVGPMVYPFAETDPARAAEVIVEVFLSDPRKGRP